MGEIANENQSVDLDTILVQEIGQFGIYQKRILALTFILGMLTTLSSNQFVFTTARTITRCLIPECETADEVNFSPGWITNAIPGTDEDSFENCKRFVGLLNSSLPIANDTCPTTLFDRDTVVPCDHFVYQDTNTIVYEYDMGCDEWLRSLVGSIRVIGMLLSLPLTGFISDRWGRRIAMTISAFNTAWLGLVRYWAGTYIGFTVSQFAEAFLGFGCFSCAYIMSMEVVGPRYRETAALLMGISVAFGQMAVALVAWVIPNWRYLTLALYTPQLLVISYLWIMPESARWYMSKGRYEESEKLLRRVARANKKELSEKSLAALKQADEDKKTTAPKNEEWLIVQVFRNRTILLRCIITPIWWITNLCVYYGLTFNAVNLLGNKYLNFLVVGAIEIPGVWIAVFLMRRYNRKPILIVGFWLCAACMFAYIFLSNEYIGLSIALYMTGKCCISCVMTVMHVYTIELYPTRHRHSLFAFSSMVGRVGSVLAPLTPALAVTIWEGLPFALFGGLALISGASVFITPETRGAKFPDTMHQAAEIGRATT